MKLKLAFVIALLAACCVAAIGQTVTVTGKKVTYRRPRPIMKEKRTFWINHPKVKAATPALSRKIEREIGFEKVIPLDVKEEINEVQWLEEADFKVDYNKNGILVVTLSIYGTSAYPSSSTKTIVVDTRTGKRAMPADVFINLDGLAAMADAAQKKEIAAAIVEIKKDPDIGDTDPQDLFVDKTFGTDDIDEFSVDDKGVTLIYDYGFPHVIQALQPEGKYFFTWAQVRPYIKPGGLLTRIAR